MPTYEYACRNCGEHLEVVQSFRDEPLTTCGNCSGALRKVFSAAGIIFKGSGYYVTDTRAKADEDKTSDRDKSTGKDNGTGKAAQAGDGDKKGAKAEGKDSGSGSGSSSSGAAESA